MSARRGLAGVMFGIVLALPSCATESAPPAAVDRGRELASSPKVSPSKGNVTTCTTCHRMDPAERPELILPGAALAGATLRKSFWGGQELDLLRSINQCRYFFMAANEPWTADDPSAVDLYAFLQSLEPLGTGALREAVPFTVVRDVSDVPAQPAGSGDKVYDRACRVCHGAPHTAEGRPRSSTPLLPEDAVSSHEYLKSRDATRLIFVEKVRHGGFLGYGGLMPPFSAEAMSDGELGALLSFLGLY